MHHVTDQHTTPPHRPLEVGLSLPTSDTPHGGCITRWTDLLAVAMRAEALGFDSVWVGDHLLFEFGPEIDPIGAWEGWSLLSALAAATTRVKIGTLVMSTSFRNPALLAKMADTVDEISAGRLVLGLGAGWHEPEFQAFGFPFDHRISRFEEAVQIIVGLLHGERLDFQGKYYRTQECELRPRGPRPDGPPIVIGAKGPRMMRLTAQYANAWDSDFIRNPSDLATLRSKLADLDAACHDSRRDPATLQRTASIMVNLPGHSQPGDGLLADWRASTQPATGSAEELAELLTAYAGEGVSRVQVWLDPNTVEGVEAFASAVELLNGT